MKIKNYKNNNIGYILMFVIIIIFIAYITYVYNQDCISCRECEGMTDSSFCVPTQNKKFYLQTKHNNKIKKVYLDFSVAKIKLDENNQSSFYITKCLKNYDDISFLRYILTPTIQDSSFVFIKTDESMNTTKIKYRTSNNNILFIKRANTKIQDKVRLGILKNNKRYWYSIENNTWIPTLKGSTIFKIMHN
jgi:hypothetical protein